MVPKVQSGLMGEWVLIELVMREDSKIEKSGMVRTNQGDLIRFLEIRMRTMTKTEKETREEMEQVEDAMKFCGVRETTTNPHPLQETETATAKEWLIGVVDGEKRNAMNEQSEVPTEVNVEIVQKELTVEIAAGIGTETNVRSVNQNGQIHR